MEDLIEFAFNNLLSRIDEFSVYVPRSQEDLSQSCRDLESIFLEYIELVRFIHVAMSLNED